MYRIEYITYCIIIMSIIIMSIIIMNLLTHDFEYIESRSVSETIAPSIAREV